MYELFLVLVWAYAMIGAALAILAYAHEDVDHNKWVVLAMLFTMAMWPFYVWVKIRERGEE